MSRLSAFYYFAQRFLLLPGKPKKSTKKINLAREKRKKNCFSLLHNNRSRKNSVHLSGNGNDIHRGGRRKREAFEKRRNNKNYLFKKCFEQHSSRLIIETPHDDNILTFATYANRESRHWQQGTLRHSLLNIFISGVGAHVPMNFIKILIHWNSLKYFQAYERRFPTCPQMPIVLDCVVMEDLMDGPKRQTKRRCKLRVDAPYIFKKIIGIEVAYFIQENFLDWKERKLTIEATNETFSSRIKIFEKCRYYVHPENPDWTCFDQSANIEITNFFGFEHQMEKVGMKQYTQMTLKGKEIIEFFIDELKEEGIAHVDVWTDPEGSVTESKKGDLENDNLQRLDAEYIRKYLGELTPLQESRLHQMRKRLEDLSLEQVKFQVYKRQAQ